MFRVAQNINKDTSFTKAQTYHPTQKQNENEEEAKTSTKPYYTACFMTCHLAWSKYMKSHIHDSHLQTHKVSVHDGRMSRELHTLCLLPRLFLHMWGNAISTFYNVEKT